MNHLDTLTALYADWCQKNDLPDNYSADDLVYDASLTNQQKDWLNGFILLWDATQDSGI